MLSFAIDHLLHHFIINNRAAVLVGVYQRIAADIVNQTRHAAGELENQLLRILRKNGALEAGVFQLRLDICFCLRQVIGLQNGVNLNPFPNSSVCLRVEPVPKLCLTAENQSHGIAGAQGTVLCADMSMRRC